MNWGLPLLLGIPLITKDEILQNHLSVLNTIDIPKNKDQFDLPYLYWIPKLHKNHYKDTLLVPVNALLSHYRRLTAIKESLQR
jgi:hypothetical protein